MTDLDGTVDDPVRAELKKNASLRSAALRLAKDALQKAGEYHAALEEEYRPWVDFKALDKFTAQHIREYVAGMKKR